MSQKQSATIQVQEHCHFEVLIAELSAKFISLLPSEVDREIENAQRLVCDCLGVDVSALWQWASSNPKFLTLTHLHAPPEGPDHPVDIDARESFPWLLAQMLKGETVAISNQELPPEAAQDQESRRFFGVKSSLVIPLSTGGGPLIGVLSFDTLHAFCDWPSQIVKRLTLIAQIFANALERKRADQELQERESRLRLASDAAGVGVWELDWQSQTFWATRQALAIFGYDNQDSVPMAQFEASIHPQDREQVRTVLKETVENRRFLDVEYRICKGGGRIRWICSRGRFQGGNPERIMGVSMDITERKQAEENLRESLVEI